jgi:hypothetical protein
MGWWETANGDVIGDGPADIIDEHNGRWTEPNQLPAAVRAEIDACYREAFGRGPTERELQELLIFCSPADNEG